MADKDQVAATVAASLSSWYKTPIGQAYKNAEKRLLNNALADNFRSQVLQIGQLSWESEFHDAMRFAHYTIVDGQLENSDKQYTQVVGLSAELPIDTHSVDIVILPHSLESSANPHQVLREVNRVLRPEGIIMILGFNPWSFWHLPRFLPGAKNKTPWNGVFISRYRLIDWLKLLNFKLEQNHGCCFLPIAKYQSSSQLHLCLDRIGKYLPFLPAAYFLMAIKRVSGATPNFNLRDLKNKLIPSLTETASSRIHVKKTSKHPHRRRLPR